MHRQGGSRYRAIDGLRGVAALLVLIFHVFWNSAEGPAVLERLPDAIGTISGMMRSGVAVFFVISGFVIAYTTRSLYRPDDAWRFIVRRQVRLDPPYYAMIAIVLVIEAAQALVPGLEHQTFAPGVVVANMFYLQDILGVPSVVPVAWTLCLEVQFYLIVVLAGLTAERLASSEQRRRSIRVGVVMVLMAASLACSLLGIDTGPWVLGLWWMFALGMVLAWYASEELPAWAVAATFASVVAVGAGSHVTQTADPWGGHWFAVATASFILALLLAGRLERSLGRVLDYFGRISYSLYLIHLPVIALVTGAGVKVMPDSLVGRVVGMVVAVGAAILAAHLLHRLVEQPAVRWSKRIRRASAEEAVTGAHAAGQ